MWHGIEAGSSCCVFMGRAVAHALHAEKFHVQSLGEQIKILIKTLKNCLSVLAILVLAGP